VCVVLVLSSHHIPIAKDTRFHAIKSSRPRPKRPEVKDEAEARSYEAKILASRAVLPQGFNISEISLSQHVSDVRSTLLLAKNISFFSFLFGVAHAPFACQR